MNARKNKKKSNIQMFSKNYVEKNHKVIKNITKELKNNKIYVKGYLKGKRINKTKKVPKKYRY